MLKLTGRTIGLSCLILGASFFTPGCNNVGDVGDELGSKPMSREDAEDAAKRVSGSSTWECQAITYTDVDGLTANAYVVGWDADGDSFAMVPTNPTDIYLEVDGYSQYLCLIDGMPVGYTLVADDSGIGADCNDGDHLVNPDAAEVCDMEDNDCNGEVDEIGGASTWYADTDEDTFGDAANASTACTQPDGYVENSADCDDGDEMISPVATEMCDTVDNDCDGTVDEADAFDAVNWYPDVDLDTYGDSAVAATVSCAAPSGAVADNGDCNDDDGTINPGATEVADDGLDNDCDGSQAFSQVCVEMDDPSDYCALYLSDMTTFPYTPDDPNWYPYAYEGFITGVLCTDDFTVVSGHSVKLNVECDDSTYGFTYWGYERSGGDRVATVRFSGVDVTGDVVVTPYDENGDGVDDGADGVVLAP